MRRTFVAALAAVSALALAHGASAQPAGPAPAPAGAPPAADAAPAAAGAPHEPLVWTLSIGMQGAYESNVLYGFYLGEGGTTGDFLTRVNAKLGRRVPVKRGRLAFSADGGGSVYQDVTELNRFDWGLGLVAGYDFTRRFSADVNVGSALGYVRDFVRVDPNSSLAPYTPARYDHGTATLRFLATPATALHLDARADRYAFQDPTPLTDGKNLVLSGGVDHTVGHGSRLSGIAEYERTAYGPTFEVERALGRWTGNVARGWALQLEAGVARYRAIAIDPTVIFPGGQDPTQARFGPVLKGTLDGQQGRHGFKLHASRNVGQTYGFGTVGSITDVGIAYGFGPVHHVTVVANADVNRTSEAPIDVPPDGLNLGAGLRWEAVRRLSFVLDAYRWSRRGGSPLINDTRWSGWAASLSAAYAFAWR